MSKDLVTAEAQQLDAYIRNAEELAKANLLPPAYRKNPANVLLAIQTGAPLGFTAMQSISGIHIINGKPTMSADMVAAAVRRAGHKLRVEGDDMTARAILIRGDDPDYEFKSVWTMERAKRAGLTSNSSWRQYPAAMLKARAITEVARQGANDALYGVIYTPEELGASVDETGAIVQAHEAAQHEPVSTSVLTGRAQEAAPAERHEPAPHETGSPTRISQTQIEEIKELTEYLGYTPQQILKGSRKYGGVPQGQPLPWDIYTMPSSVANTVIDKLRKQCAEREAHIVDAEIVEDEQ